MFNHEPANYECPFCTFLNGGGDKYTQQEDVVFKNDYTTIVIAPRWWTKNSGSVLVVPNRHSENIYDIPDEYISEVYKTVKKISIAIKAAYKCDGTSTRQHNEPAGGQDVWHFHGQVLPRYAGDNLYKNTDQNRFVDAETRAPFADKLREYFTQSQG
jgi:histidine triad (HIT) family protein